MLNILIVEDDVSLNKLMATALKKNGYDTSSAYSVADAYAEMEKRPADLVVSDIMMPETDGFEFVKALRATSHNMPVLFVTAKDSFEDKKRGFLLGADDYLVKPIDINEMILRVGALLRRAKIANEHRLIIGNTVLDYDSLTVTEGSGQKTLLPQKEFLVLFKLLSYPSKIFTRSQLMDEIWGAYSDSFERTVDVHIVRIREKFKNNEDFEIMTVRGLGYKAEISKKNTAE